jgi:hypothetical protein
MRYVLVVISSEETKRLRTTSFIALFSDDDLLEALVLKGAAMLSAVGNVK